MGFAGFTASETARRCEGPWRRGCVLQGFLAYRSTRRNPFARPASARGLLAVFGAKVAKPPLFLRVLNLSRHLNSPGGPSLSFRAKARQFSRVPKYASKSFRTPASARRLLAVFGAKAAKPLSSRASSTLCPGRSACQELSFLLPGVILCCIATLDGASSRSKS